MYGRVVWLISIVSLLFACQEGEFQDNYEELVVEGWIESGGSPVVILTKTFTVTTQEETDEDESLVLPWGKVTVSDGNDTVVLTGGMDKNETYFPSYIYTTSRMEGEAGRTYYLTVEYGDRVATAQTTIPMPDSLESLTVTPCADVDSMYQITAFFDDDPTTEDYYMFLTRIFNREKRYYPSFLGVVDDKGLAQHNRQAVQPGIHYLSNEEQKYSPYYHESDTVLIKFAKVDETTYGIQKAYNEMVSLSYNPVFTNEIVMPTNIQGGLGYWCGYAVTRYNVIIADSIK